MQVFSLGENEMYDKIEGDGLFCRFLDYLSRKTMGAFGFSLPACHGTYTLKP